MSRAIITDKYILASGRTPEYDRKAFSDDLLVAASFLVWSECSEGWHGGESAADAFLAVCRMLDLDPIALRRIVKGEP